MTEDDNDGYTTEAELERIRKWDARDGDGLLDFAVGLFDRNGYGSVVRDTIDLNSVLRMSTGGWSDNEQVIYAMQDNKTWWAMHWYSSRRGGHHEFLIREKKP